MYHKVCPFKVYKFVFLVYSQSCALITTNSGTFSSPPERNPGLTSSHSPCFFFWPLEICNLFSILKDFPVINVFGLFHLTWRLYSYYRMYQYFIPFLWLNNINILLCTYNTFCLSIFQLVDKWVVSAFWLIMINAAINNCVQVLFCIYVISQVCN